MMIEYSAHAVSTMIFKWGIYLLTSFSVLNMIIQYSCHRSVSTKITNSEEIYKIFFLTYLFHNDWNSSYCINGDPWYGCLTQYALKC